MTATERRPVASWTARLDFADRLLAESRPTPQPGWLADQRSAAVASNAHTTAMIAQAFAAAEPDLDWHTRAATSDRRQQTYVLAALLGVPTVCHHIRNEGPQLAIAALALHRIACRRCAQSFRNPPPGEEDRCDYCGRRGVIRFAYAVVGYGPVTVLGDACGTCAIALGAGKDPGS